MEAVGAFTAWCASAGVWQDERVVIAHDPATGLGLYAAAPIDAGAELLRVPQRACLSAAACAAARPSLAPLLASLDAANALALALCAAPAADLAPWAALWPRHPPGGWGMPPSLRAEAAWWRELFALHEAQEAAARRAHAALGSAAPPWAEYARACALVASRGVAAAAAEGSARPALAPLLDLLNHAGAGASCGVAHAEDGLAVAARRALRAGEPLTISYGAKDNAALAAGYGFAETENAHDALRLRVPLGGGGEALAAQRLAMLPRGVAAGAPHEQPAAWVNLSCDALTPRLSDELRLVLALACARETAELFGAVGRAAAGRVGAEEWALLRACCGEAAEALPRDAAVADGKWAAVVAAALASRRALLRRAAELAEEQLAELARQAEHADA